jgi:hypothetical protein
MLIEGFALFLHEKCIEITYLLDEKHTEIMCSQHFSLMFVYFQILI